MEHIDIKKFLSEDALTIYNILNNNGYKVYFVGGALRDVMISNILGYKCDIRDWDITTNARALDITKIFNKRLRIMRNGGIINVNGKATLLIPMIETMGVSLGGPMVEVTPLNFYNGEFTEFTNELTLDLYNRDFTINSMVYSFKEGLISSFEVDGNKINAIEDIKRKVIKSVSNPDEYFRRNEYAMFRAIIFANQFDFYIEEDTYKSMLRNMDRISNTHERRLLIGFRKFIKLNAFPRINYLIESKMLNVLCSKWNEKFDKEFVDILNRMVLLEKDFDVRIDYLVNNFSDKDIILELLASFGLVRI